MFVCLFVCASERATTSWTEAPLSSSSSSSDERAGKRVWTARRRLSPREGIFPTAHHSRAGSDDDATGRRKRSGTTPAKRPKKFCRDHKQINICTVRTNCAWTDTRARAETKVLPRLLGMKKQRDAVFPFAGGLGGRLEVGLGGRALFGVLLSCRRTGPACCSCCFCCCRRGLLRCVAVGVVEVWLPLL